MATITITYTGPGGGSTKTITFANADLTTIQSAFTYFAQRGQPPGLPPLTPDQILAILAGTIHGQVKGTVRRFLDATQPAPAPDITQS